MASNPEELRKTAHRSKLLALQATDPEQRAKLFAMAADIERQAIEAEQTLLAEESALPRQPVQVRAARGKRRWLRRRLKTK